MAATKALLYVTYKDIGGNLTVRTYELAQSTYAGTITVGELETQATALVALLQGVTDCGIVSGVVSITFPATAPSAPAAGAEMENTAALSLPLNVVGPSGLTAFGLMNIPGPKDAIFVSTSGPNRNVVDMENEDVTDLVDVFSSNGDGNDFTMSDGQSVKAAYTAEADGRRVHRRSKRSRGRRIG